MILIIRKFSCLSPANLLFSFK
jgi:decaprenyl-diphosphate synthase subunit 1